MLFLKSYSRTWYINLWPKTEYHLKVRSSEDIGISHLTGKRVECKPSAALDHLHNHEEALTTLLSYVEIIMVSDFY